MASPDETPPKPGTTGEVRPATGQQRGDVAAFLAEVKARQPVVAAGRARLVFALDATMSRQPTWDLAVRLQGEMFAAASEIGSLDVQLVYFRGLTECRASKWVSDAARLGALMSRIVCRGGNTQIRRVLAHAVAETKRQRVQAVVFVGDALEEPIDELCALAGELALLGVPVFLFQEGWSPTVEAGFREIARLTRGAWCRFDTRAAQELSALLRAVAAYAAGGRAALDRLVSRNDTGARLLLKGMTPR